VLVIFQAFSKSTIPRFHQRLRHPGSDDMISPSLISAQITKCMDVITRFNRVITKQRKIRFYLVLHDLFICVTEVSCKDYPKSQQTGTYP